MKRRTLSAYTRVSIQREAPITSRVPRSSLGERVVFRTSIGFRRRTLDDPRGHRIDGSGSRAYGITLRTFCLARGKRFRREATLGDAISVWRASRKSCRRQVSGSDRKSGVSDREEYERQHQRTRTTGEPLRHGEFWSCGRPDLAQANSGLVQPGQGSAALGAIRGNWVLLRLDDNGSLSRTAQ